MVSVFGTSNLIHEMQVTTSISMVKDAIDTFCKLSLAEHYVPSKEAAWTFGSLHLIGCL